MHKILCNFVALRSLFRLVWYVEKFQKEMSMRLLCMLFCLLSSCFANDEATKENKVCGDVLSFEKFQAKAIESGFVETEKKLKRWYEAYTASCLPTTAPPTIVNVHIEDGGTPSTP